MNGKQCNRMKMEKNECYSMEIARGRTYIGKFSFQISLTNKHNYILIKVHLWFMVIWCFLSSFDLDCGQNVCPVNEYSMGIEIHIWLDCRLWTKLQTKKKNYENDNQRKTRLRYSLSNPESITPCYYA